MEQELVTFIGSFTAFASVGIPFVLELIFKYWTIENKTLKSFISFILAILLTAGVYGLGLVAGIGFLVGATVTEIILYGVGAGLVSTFSWINVKWVKAFIELITRSKKKQK